MQQQKKPLLLNEVIGDDQKGDGAKVQAKHSVIKSLVVQLGGFLFCFVLTNWFLFCTIEETYTGCPKTTGYKIQSRPRHHEYSFQGENIFSLIIIICSLFSFLVKCQQAKLVNCGAYYVLHIHCKKNVLRKGKKSNPSSNCCSFHSHIENLWKNFHELYVFMENPTKNLLL
jgi:hypothetical protein